jgi:hypothetical protein
VFAVEIREKNEMNENKMTVDASAMECIAPNQDIVAPAFNRVNQALRAGTHASHADEALVVAAVRRSYLLSDLAEGALGKQLAGLALPAAAKKLGIRDPKVVDALLVTMSHNDISRVNDAIRVFTKFAARKPAPKRRPQAAHKNTAFSQTRAHASGLTMLAI